MVYGAKYWSRIAREINNRMHNGVEIRLGKNCREHWCNYINPELRSKFYSEGDWTNEEDRIILV